MSVPYWKDQKVFAVNKEDPRTTFMVYDDKKTALTNDYAKSPYYRLLNGTWKFYYADTYQSLPGNITDCDADCSKWADITVPGNWEVQGFGTPIYTNQAYEFWPNLPKPPLLPENIPVGVYRRDIDVPAEWFSRDIYLHIGAAKSGVYVYLNNQEVGYSEDSKDPAEFLINKYIQPGKNTLVVKMFRFCTGTYLEDQDFWRISGFERDVYIWSQPKVHVQNFDVVSTLDKEYKDGLLKLTVTMHNDEASEQKATVEYQLETIDGKEVAKGTTEVAVAAGKRADAVFEATIPSVEKWSAEHPTLYRLIMTTKVGGKVNEVIPFKIGFRKFEFTKIRQGEIDYPVYLVNGVPVKFRGVNVHEHNKDTGHYVTDEIRRKDMELLKQHNFNAIRNCHYPNDRRLYEICDEYGLYVVSESNIETHGLTWDLDKTVANDPKWLDNHMERVINMYERTKNHACVTMFSLANEAGNGYCFYAAYKYIKDREVKGMNRAVNYERAVLEWNTDMDVPMYVKTEWFIDKGVNGSDRPVCPWEFSHAMGNSNGNFNRMWNVMYQYPNLQGAFIWDWVDQGFVLKDEKGVEYFTYGGDYDYGVPSDGNFNINGLVNPDRNPHPAMGEIKYTLQYVGFTPVDIEKGVFRITNRFDFSCLKDYEISYQIVENGKPLRGDVIKVELKPHESKEVTIKYGDLPRKPATEYFINFSVKQVVEKPFLPKGFEMAHDQFRLPVEPAEKAPAKEQGPELTLTEGECVTVQSSKVKVAFNKLTGVLSTYKVDGVDYIHDGFGLQPTFWRGPNDNDYGNDGPAREQIWKQMGKKFNVAKTYASVYNNVATIRASYALETGHELLLTYRVYPSGVLNVFYKLTPPAHVHDQPNIPRVGLRFRIDKEYHNVEYFGRGPEENYWDRKAGAAVGHYKSTAEEMYFPYVRPQENGHHTEVRWLALEKDNGEGLLIDADTLVEFNALRNPIEDFDDEEHVNRPRQYQFFGGGLQFNGIADEEHAVNHLRRQTHINDIIPHDYVEVVVDYKQQGLAGYDSWGDKVEPQFTLPADRIHEYGFTMIPIKNGQEIADKIKVQY